MPKFRDLLKNRNFILYSAGQAFSQFGDRLVQIALIGFVYKRWPGSTFQLAKILLFTLLPSFFISPIAGVYTDRWNKRYIMIISDLLRAAMILLVPLLFIYRENIVPIYIIIFFVFATACFFLPARLAVIPNLVAKEDILLANSASSITWVVSAIVGFSFGGFLVEWIGVKNTLYVNSSVYLASAICFLVLAYFMRKESRSTRSEELYSGTKKQAAKSFFHDLKEGLKTVLSDRTMKFIMYLCFTLSSLVGGIYVVSVVFIQETLHSMTSYIGFFSICIFCGLLAGSYIYGKIGAKLPKAKTVFISLLLTGIFIDLFAIALKVMTSFWLGSVSAGLLGFFIAPIYVTANTVIHESVESKLRGRIFSYMGIVMNFGFLLFMFFSSIVAEHVGKFWIIISCGSGFIIFGIVCITAGFLKDLTFSSS